jgi:hypothetical protein
LKAAPLIAAAGLLLSLAVSAHGDATSAAELEKARAELRLSEQTRDRVSAELAALKASGKASAEVVAAYEAYLARVEDMVVEHNNLVSRMEAAYHAHLSRSQTAAPDASAATGAAPPSPGSQEEPADRLKALDRQFNESLAAFDEMLLKELKLIKAAASKRMQGLAEAAAEAGRQAGEKAAGTTSAGAGAPAEAQGGGAAASEAEKGGTGTEQAKDPQGRGKPGDAAGPGQAAGGWGSGGTGAPPSGYPPSADDDIVARQLREAAEKETDPELKAKLWKEYEAYKKSQARP